MKALSLDGSEKVDHIFQTGEQYEVFVAFPRMTHPDLFLFGTDNLEFLNECLVRLSVAVKIQEEHSIVIELRNGGKWYRYSVDLETGELFPEFKI
jgi:hypothetical protein